MDRAGGHNPRIRIDGLCHWSDDDGERVSWPIEFPSQVGGFCHPLASASCGKRFSSR